MEQELFGFMGDLDASRAERPARMSASRENAQGWPREAERGQVSPFILHDFAASYGLNGHCGKMYPEFLAPTAEEILRDSLTRLGTAGILSHGGCWTANSCEWTSGAGQSPRDGGVCGLSDVLEMTGGHLRKYYLSRKDCEGIIRRAAKRGKKLPQMLEDALKDMIAMWKEQERMARTEAER